MTIVCSAGHGLSMDNFTHSLAGWALGQTGLKTKSRKALAALILGANLPDIDVFFGWVPWLPLATHRGFTHGLLGGIVIMPAMLAALLWLLDRWQCSRGEKFASGLPMNGAWLLLLSYLGALTHPLLDLQTSYAVQLLSPFSTRWFHTDTLFIIDAMLWTVLPLAIWLSRRRERLGLPWRRPAIAGLVVACAYILLNGGITLMARHALASELGWTPQVIYAGEEPVLFWTRNLVWRQGDRVGQAQYDPLHSLTHVTDIQPMIPDGMRDPLVGRAIAAAPGLKPFLNWSTMPMAFVRRGQCEAQVELMDARFMPAIGDRSVAPRARPFGHPPVMLSIEGRGCP
ncbi:metal-dependent hydrolase [Sphingobium sp. WCS2017Hpa-17]|uniref:metal-dependent hydrolase n=1 Tax=Sphingobium sp. WCS2017Hpa-17 TaxID=3073638 RepID=UPI00288BEF53|nr:metal-dependent hydrolase [Sphingobium sp. WCS2017Hpa-17]